MALKSFTAEGGSNGVTPLTTDARPNTFSVVTPGTSNTLTYTTSTPLKASVSLAFASAGGTASTICTMTDTAAASVAVRLYINMTAYPAAEVQGPISGRSSANAHLFRTQITTAGAIRAVSGATTGAVSGSVLALNTTYRIEVTVTGLNTASTVTTVNVYVGDSLTLFTSATATGTTAALCDRITYGKNSATTWALFKIDDIAQNIGSSTLIGPSGNLAPNANAGTDLVGIEAYSTVSLTGTDSDSDGTVASRAWRVISTTNGAATPALTGATTANCSFTAPGTLTGTVITLGYKVTDNLGLDSIEDQIAVTVLAATDRAIIGGVQVPMRSGIVGV